MPQSNAAYFCVDMGTTKTRVWLIDDHRVWASSSEEFGVRNVAQGNTHDWLAERLRGLLGDVRKTAERAGLEAEPQSVFAAGMITSAQGLKEVSHIEAPAAAETVARHLVHAYDVDLGYPLMLVPGVRTGNSTAVLDVMRGEETLCFGLQAAGKLAPGSVLFNLGSHWKWIWMDDRGCIGGSRTTLSGEAIHAIQEHTLLAAALPDGRPTELDLEWIERGAVEERRSGLMRALFTVRLLQQQAKGTAAQRLAYLYGAFIESEMETLLQHAAPPEQIWISGALSVAAAWQDQLKRRGLQAKVLHEDEKEAAYLDGLRLLMHLHTDHAVENNVLAQEAQ